MFHYVSGPNPISWFLEKSLRFPLKGRNSVSRPPLDPRLQWEYPARMSSLLVSPLDFKLSNPHSHMEQFPKINFSSCIYLLGDGWMASLTQ